MYTIFKGTDGKFHCEGRLQDGTERWTKDTLDEAVESLKQFAETMNGAKGPHRLKRKHISYYESVQVVKTEWIKKPMPGKGN